MEFRAVAGETTDHRTDRPRSELLTLNKVDSMFHDLATVQRAPLKRPQAFSARCLSTSSSGEDTSSTAQAPHRAARMWESEQGESHGWGASVVQNPRSRSTHR